jgi:hypothetical protein
VKEGGVSLQDLLELMSRALEGISSLPWGVHLAVALAMAAGLVIWLAGEKFLKPMVVLLCAGIGATAGLLLTSATPWGQSGSMGAYHHLFIGMGIGAVLGFLVFRSAAALGLGVVLAMLLPLGTAAIINFAEGSGAGGRSTRAMNAELVPSVVMPAGFDETRAVVRAVRFMQDEPAAEPGAGPIERAREAVKVDRVPENLKPGVEAVSAFWDKLGEQAREGWNRWSGRDQAILATVAALGLAIGVIWGMSVPKWSGVAISAMFGAAVWMPAFVWLSNAMGAPWTAALDLSPLHWLAVWGGVGAVGMAVQYSGIIPGTKPKAAGGGAKPAAAPAK